ncbi:flagellar motor protein MotB [Celeribacter arenosi]|uniref:Flagellar motor protein MotB n=1 Tax=Celeribacter arenosi TaxID=792649 RepID=A0ABP7JZ95_9RHOB
MSAKSNAPIIIKRKKVIAGDGHHGGAWKVAYADFVTAMMAFFLLMWLLNATTEKQRKGIADYFNPTIPVNRISGGGDGSFGGDSVFTEETLSQNGTGASMITKGDKAQTQEETEKAMEAKGFADVQELLTAFSGESMAADDAMRHIVTKVTDEGLIIELFDFEDEPLFVRRTALPEQVTRELIAVLAEAATLVRNKIAVKGYVASQPIVVADNPVWDLSYQRADAIRVLLENSGVASNRFDRISGHADKNPSVSNTMAARNNRLEIVLLRDEGRK